MTLDQITVTPICIIEKQIMMYSFGGWVREGDLFLYER